MATVTCPTCGHPVPVTADFCANCGRPRTSLQQELERRSRSTGIPYQTLLEQERVRAGIPVLSARTIGQIQTKLQHVEDTLGHLDQRLRLVEEYVPGIEPAPAVREAPAPAAPIITEAPVSVEPEPTPVPLGIRIPEPVAVPEVPVPPEISVVPERVRRPVEPLFPPLATAGRREFDLEDLLSGRVLAWTGGLAILVGAVFFLSLAFSRGWIGPTARVIIGIAAASAMLAVGGWFFERRERIFGHVLVATGLGVMNISLLAATRLYDLIAVPVGLVAILASALVAAVIAVRARSQIVAGYGLIAALVAPPLLGAESDLPTALFVGMILVGTTGIALFQTWRWLPPLAFILSAPQVADLLASDINAAIALLVLAGFWALNSIAAGGEEFRLPSQRVSVTSATLLMLNAAYLIGMGFVILDGDLDGWRGLFLIGAAIAHGALGFYFLRRQGQYHPFGMLATGTGVAALTMAIPVQLGGPVVPIAWAAEATALAWIFGRRKHIYAGAYAVVLGLLSIGHLTTVEYPLDQLQVSENLDSTWPFLNANGGTLAYMLAAILVAGYFIRNRMIRIALAIVALSLTMYAVPFELSGVTVAAAWAALFVGAVALQRWPVLAEQPLKTFEHGLYIPAAIAAILSVVHALTFELPLSGVDPNTLPDVPFTDERTLVAVILLAAATAASFITRNLPFAIGARVAAFAFAAYLMPFELELAGVVVVWSALAVSLAYLSQREPAGQKPYLTSTGTLLGGGLMVILYAVAPLSRLMVRETVTLDHPPLWSGATAALGALIVALGFIAWLYDSRPEIVRWLAALAGALAVYLLSVAVVDEFQSRVGGETALESLQKQAQVALSILWASLGGLAFATGILRFGAPVRLFGLALLALATVKVFIIDLAALDTSYRVLSFIGLGILLLVSSYIYQHYKGRFDKGHGGTTPHLPTGQQA